MGKHVYAKPVVVTYTAQDLAEVLGPAQGLSSGVSGSDPASIEKSSMGAGGSSRFGR